MDVDMEDTSQQLLLTTAFSNTTLGEDIYFEIRDIVYLALTPERHDWRYQSRRR